VSETEGNPENKRIYIFSSLDYSNTFGCQPNTKAIKIPHFPTLSHDKFVQTFFLKQLGWIKSIVRLGTCSSREEGECGLELK